MTLIRRAMSRGRLLAAGCLVVAALTAPARAAGVLDQVPGDALVVLKFNHLADTSTKVAGLMQALGVTDFVPAMADPLAAVQDKLGMSAGIDKASDAAVVLLNGKWTEDGNPPQNKPPMLVLVPVADYKAFIAGMTVVKTEGDVTTVHFKDNSENAFVANWGSFAAVAPLQEYVAKKPDGMQVTGLAAKQLTDGDAAIYLNMPVLKTVLLPKLEKGREQAMKQLERSITGANADKLPLVKAIVNQFINGGQRFLEDSSATSIALNITKAGVNQSVIAEFTPDSYLGKFAGQLKGTDQPLMGGLPDVKYLFYGGGTQDPAALSQVVDDILAPIMKELPALGDDGKKVADAIDAYKAGMITVERGSFGAVAPSGALGRGSLLQMVSVYKADAEKMKSGMEKEMQVQQDMMQTFGGPDAKAVTTTLTPNAKTVDGIAFDQMQTKYTGPRNTAQQMQMAQMMNMMYGPNGFTVFTGVVDPKTLAFAAGGDDKLLSALVAAAKEDKDTLSTGDLVKAVDAELPKTRLGVAYLPLDSIITTAVGYMKAFIPVQITLPPNLPPIGFSFGSDGSALRFDEHVPTQLVQSLIQAGMQVYVKMNGGQGGGAGGGGL